MGTRFRAAASSSGGDGAGAGITRAGPGCCVAARSRVSADFRDCPGRGCLSFPRREDERHVMSEMDAPFHEVAALFPPMESEEYASLVASIQQHGLREPLWRYQGKIIDGRHRYRACRQLGIEPTYREWDGNGSLVAFVVSLNYERRHLTSSQKAIVALEIEAQLAQEARQQMARGGASHRGNQHTGQTREEGFQQFENLPTIHAAKQSAVLAGTNHQYVIDAKKIARQAPELKDQVKSGALSLPQAKTLHRCQRSNGTRPFA
jgi:hypothetical protein